MLKRLILAGLLSLVTVSAFAAGTIPGISMTQQLDEFAKPLSGGKLYLIQAGTTSTPQNCYQDTALTLAYPNPVTLDAAGRVPQLFCADGNIKIRLTDRNGSQKLIQDNLLVVGPSGGGGGGGTVDPTTIIQTGMTIPMYGTGILSGFVRANGRTIGSATSGATERANADCQALFVYLWGADANLVVSGGRGASAAADWAANKTIALPDFRGRVVAGMDDMGNSAAGRLTSSYFGATATTLGAVGGSESHTTTIAEMPAHTHANSLNDPGHIHSEAGDSSSGGVSARIVAQAGNGTNSSANGNTTVSALTGITITNASAGSGNAHAIVQPTILTTFYIKL